MLLSFSEPADIAVELSYHANQVYISTRSGCYVVTRLGKGGQPFDVSLTRLTRLVPFHIGIKFHPAFLNNQLNFKNFGLQPTGTVGVHKFPIVNDGITHRIMTGSIKVKGNIDEIAESSVRLSGGEMLNDIDALVLATGFKPSFDFAKDIIEVKEEFYVSLYKHVFLPEDDWHTLAVIGAIGVSGPLPPVAEMQARVAAEVFAGRCDLPSSYEIRKEIDERERWWANTGTSKYNFMRVCNF